MNAVWYLMILVLAFASPTVTAVAQEIGIDWTPKEITRAVFLDTTGTSLFERVVTPVVTFRVTNNSATVIELRPSGWVSLRGPAKKELLEFVPPPATMEPGGSTEVVWHLHSSSQYVFPGTHEVTVTYRLRGHTDWTTASRSFQVHRSPVDYGVGGILAIAILVMAAKVLLLFLPEKRR